MKKMFFLMLSMIMLMTFLTACKTTGDNTKESVTAGNDTIEEQSKDTVDVNEELPDEDYANYSEKETGKNDKGGMDNEADSSLPVVDVNMADEVGGDVHLSWRNMSSEDGNGIEVCRADSENGDYEVIATITDEFYGYLSDGYIDQGAAGKGYYYGVRLMNSDSHSAMGDVMKAAATEYPWYKNDNSYLRLIQQPDDPSYLIQFYEYDLSGNTTWNCDWPCMENQDVFTWQVNDTEYTRTFQYCFSTPMEYGETDMDPFTYYANVDSGEFTLTMYHYDDEQYLPVFNDTIYQSFH